MPRRSERDLLNARFPDDPIPGIIGGLLILVVSIGIGDGTLLLSRTHGGFVLLMLGAAILGATPTLTSLNRLGAFLRYERRFRAGPGAAPEPSLDGVRLRRPRRDRHRRKAPVHPGTALGAGQRPPIATLCYNTASFNDATLSPASATAEGRTCGVRRILARRAEGASARRE